MCVLRATLTRYDDDDDDDVCVCVLGGGKLNSEQIELVVGSSRAFKHFVPLFVPHLTPHTRSTVFTPAMCPLPPLLPGPNGKDERIRRIQTLQYVVATHWCSPSLYCAVFYANLLLILCCH